MTRGKVKKDIDIILQKLEKEFITFCEAKKEIFKIVDKLYEVDTYNYNQCHHCEEDPCDLGCEPNQLPCS